MYVEVYADSLFLVHFVMNLYLLVLINGSMFRVSRISSLILGALIGAAINIVPFLIGKGIGYTLIFCIVLGTVVMIAVAFPVKKLSALCGLCERYAAYACCLGGALLLLLRLIPGIQIILDGVFGLLGAGLLLFLWFRKLLRKESEEKENYLCVATLVQGDRKVTVEALLDSGNHLIEPISKKPVCIINPSLKARLFQENNSLYRAIPFHSIGKKNGILEGLLLDELYVEYQGVEKMFKGVCVAVAKEGILGNNENAVQMIIHPMLYQTVK